jgi:hypothetical protein
MDSVDQPNLALFPPLSFTGVHSNNGVSADWRQHQKRDIFTGCFSRPVKAAHGETMRSGVVEKNKVADGNMATWHAQDEQ